MLVDPQVVDVALAFAATKGLKQCVPHIVGRDEENWVITVEGINSIDVETYMCEATSDEDRAAIKSFFADPFELRIVISQGMVLSFEWIGVQLS